MFNADFYPTPRPVIDRMIAGIDLKGSIVLEPSAGSGAILSVLKEFGAKTIACEKHPDLAKIAMSKADRFLTYDFLQVESTDISHINYIVANPPFSCADRHIEHMWNIAPEGCQIIALCNSATLENRFSNRREHISNLIKDHGNFEYLGNCFSDAERKTEVNVSLVRLFKPKTGENEFEGYFDLSEEYEQQENGIMQYNEIRNIVNRYVAAVQKFEAVMEASKEINDLMRPINPHEDIYFGAFIKDHNRRFEHHSVDRDTFKKELQKMAWKSIFNKMDMRKYVTKSVMEDINKFCEQQQMVPFTMKNIYKMIDMIIGTHANRMNRVIIEAFEKICRYSDVNSEAGETWKTNSGYKINKNFIKPWICEMSYNAKMSLIHGCYEDLDDIVKALCFITGKRYEDQPDIWKFVRNNPKIDSHGNIVRDEFQRIIYQELEFGKWYKWNDFFEIKGFKKRTMHFRFIDENAWYLFNKKVSEIKGWRLPSKTDTRKTGKERQRKAGVEVYEESYL